MIIAFIGTRLPGELPIQWVNLYTHLAELAGSQGHEISTGAGPGCDQIAAAAALRKGSSVRLYLPWPSFESEWVRGVRRVHGARVAIHILPNHIPREWLESVRNLHPSGGSLTPGAVRLHARNYGIVASSEQVVALPSDKPGGGGTGQGIRVAEALKKPLWNLMEAESRSEMERLLKKANRLKRRF